MSLDATCSHPRCTAEGTYWMSATCGNCSREYDVELTKGHDAVDSHPVCSFCGMSDRWAWKPRHRPAQGKVLGRPLLPPARREEVGR